MSEGYYFRTTVGRILTINGSAVALGGQRPAHLAEGHFRARSLPLNVKYEIDAVALITQCVEAGLGVSLLPGGCLRMDIEEGRIRVKPFAEGGCRRSIVTVPGNGDNAISGGGSHHVAR
jgi:DNA-binding transcriptional LysR family regulator